MDVGGNDDGDGPPPLCYESDSDDEDDRSGSRGASSSGGGVIVSGSSRAISPEMKEVVREAISELNSEKFALFGGSGDVDALRVEELVDLWVLFPLEPSDREVTLRIA